jgi:thioesterase DpgC
MLAATDSLAVYDRLTERRTRFVRVDELCARAAKELPEFLPSAEQLAAEAPLHLRDKKGLEAAQGRFLGHVLGDAAPAPEVEGASCRV